MYKTKLHGGKMEDCKTCTPIQKKKRERKDDKPRRQRAGTLELTLRRQMAEAIGEEELSKDERFALMMHFGLIAPRIDRRVSRPNWMPLSEWNRKKKEFHTATTGLVSNYRQQTLQKVNNDTDRPNKSTFRKAGSYAPVRRNNEPQKQSSKVVV
jgi:hypothetical protein